MLTNIYIFISLCMTIFCVLLISPVATKIGLVDRPDHRKRHSVPVPLVGGICVLFGSMFAALLMHISLQPYRSLFLGSGILLLTGVLDDFNDISPKLRLGIQFFSAFLVIYPGKLWLADFGYLLGPEIHFLVGPAVGAVITIVAVMTMINAMNMIDGQDGLLGGVAFIQLGWLAWLAHISHLHTSYHLLLVILGSLLGFLCFNFRLPGRSQALIFMGDAGSTVLGFITAWFCIYLAQSGHMPVSIRPISFLWIIAFPLFDLSSSMLRRLISGKSPLRPDRGHMHHVIARLVPGIRLSSFVLYVLTFIFGAIGVFGEQYGAPTYLLFLLFCLCWLIYFMFVAFSNRWLSDH